jgi:superfamily I DNA and/or RNA helicase
LPEGARVGTVDKFQGQEAEVVIVSMTTSSGQYLPRDIEFLYSKNRLNVAVSRARCLAVVVSSPLLLEVDCKTPEQMALVNTLCWIKDYSCQ